MHSISKIFNKIKSRQYGLSHIILLKNINQFLSKTHSKLRSRYNTVWLILIFQGFYQVFIKVSYYFLILQTFKKLNLRYYGLPQVALSKIFYKFHPKSHMYFGFQNFIKRDGLGEMQFGLCCLFKDIIQMFTLNSYSS